MATLCLFPDLTLFSTHSFRLKRARKYFDRSDDKLTFLAYVRLNYAVRFFTRQQNWDGGTS
jgi:hypothetical protein